MSALQLIDAVGSVDRVRDEPRLAATLQRLSHAGRQFGNIEALVEDLAGIVADAIGVRRLLVFLKCPGDTAFRLRCGIRDYADSAHVAQLVYGETHDLVFWLQFNAHIVSRASLSSVTSLNERVMLESVLDTHAAEALVPLFGRHELLGWLLLGRHGSGRPFHEADLRDMLAFAEHMAITLENALLHQLVERQRALTQALISHLPDGVVAIDHDGIVRWANRRTCEVLSVPEESTIDQPVERLGSRVADALRRSLHANGGEVTKEWEDPVTKEWEDPVTLHPISITSRRLVHEGDDLGAMAVIRDMHRERRLQLREASVERKAFYQGLADAIAHEVGNACSHFILPFHTLHSSGSITPLVLEMADTGSQRLEELPKLFYRLATMSDPVFKPCRIRDVVAEAIRQARAEAGSRACPVSVQCQPGISRVEADPGLLADCLCRILVNAMEAPGECPPREVHIEVQSRGANRDHVVVEVNDNGPGLSADLRGDPFSPFTTTKCWPGGGLRHIGLGLPIARRIVQDHNGEISLDSGKQGVRVTLILPAHQADGVDHLPP